jgi:UDP-N-acetylmuramoyl-L-alanyl-D-glutamate--2,6-diaminopimelate ligase
MAATIPNQSDSNKHIFSQEDLRQLSQKFQFVSSKSQPAQDGDWIFVAIDGTKVDGHLFIEDAATRGAGMAIVSRPVEASIPCRVVSDCRAALSELVTHFEGYPSSKLSVIGITGTNGKTTTNWLIHHALNLIGRSSVRIGTLGYAYPGPGGEVEGDTGLTTPDSESVQKILRAGLDNGASSAVLEVSSHALSQKRTSDIEFDIAVFTNLTRDHLDFHGTEDNYREAKWGLFSLLQKSRVVNPAKLGIAVINIDDATGRIFADRIKSLSGLRVITYGRGESNIKIVGEKQSFEGSTISYICDGEKIEISGPFIGAHNAENIAAVLGVLKGLGISLNRTSELLGELPAVPGRLQPVRVSDKFGVFVDYAHTPDALIRVLSALRPLTPGRLSVIFGCGGDRDKGKRPLMRSAATELADRVFITSDNPRSENPIGILSDITADANEHELSKINIEVDRRLSIRRALSEMNPGDVLLVAGKGHENYQIIGSVRHSFSDAQVVTEQFSYLQRERPQGNSK